MSDDEQLRLIATVQDRASIVLRKIRGELKLFGETRVGEGLKRDVERMNVGLERMRDRFKDIRKENVRGLFEGIGLGAISAGGAVAGFSELLKSYAEQREGLADMAKQINFNVQSLHLLQGAGERMGIGADQMNAGLQSFNKALADMKMHKGDLYTWLSHSNSPLEKQIEHAKTTQRAFELYVGYMSTLKNQSVRDRFAQYGFHDQAFARLADIQETKENLEREGRFGFVIKPEDIEKAQRFQAAMDDVKTSMRGLGDAISSKVMPVFTPMMEDFANWVRDHRDDIATWFRKVAESIRSVDWASVGRSVGDAFGKIGFVLQKVNDVVEKLGGWGKVLAVLTALKAANALGVSSFAGNAVGAALGGAAGGVGLGAVAGGAARFAGPWAIPAMVAAFLNQFDGKGNLWGLTGGIDAWVQKHLGFNPSNVTIGRGHVLAPGLSSTGTASKIDPATLERARRAQQAWEADPEAARGRALMRAADSKLRELSGQKAIDDRAKDTGQTIGTEASKTFVDGFKQWLSGLSPTAFGGVGPGGGVINAAFHPGSGFAGRVMGFRRSFGGGGGFPSSYAPGQVPANMLEGAKRAYSGLRALGFSDVAAAALAGNFQRESAFNPNALNAREGAHGIMQWRLGRWSSLQNFAASLGKSPNDFQTQLAFVKKELDSPAYRRFGEALRKAKTLAEANHILRGYIGYGDNSEGTRGRNAAGILKRLQRAAPDAVTTHKVNGEATVRVKFDGLPPGSKASAHAKCGLFREVKLDLGQSMQGATA